VGIQISSVSEVTENRPTFSHQNEIIFFIPPYWKEADEEQTCSPSLIKNYFSPWLSLSLYLKRLNSHSFFFSHLGFIKIKSTKMQKYINNLISLIAHFNSLANESVHDIITQQ